ncbi:MAG: DUF1553 domain-containing protein [Pirellulaceae bacterium]|jgi:hypothetical protein|nr:DUF1553 domain-containing protein [Pirellulaceae bacterium]
MSRLAILARLLSISIALLCLVGQADRGDADERAQRAFFEQKIRPVLVEHCYQCHAATAQPIQGGLRLDSQAGWQAGGDSTEPAVVPGNPDESPLIQAVRYRDGLEMPPDGKLSSAIVADLERWVRDGAFDPRDETPIEIHRADKSWWSLQPLPKLEAQSEDADPKNGSKIIDALVARQLAQQGLARNPPADARTLIRRMNYDVIGLPPTLEEVRDFTSQYASDPQAATQQLVERLLASPHYGEQWGRHWLDVVRFGESIGFERNVIINDAWPFRDYVINSLNADKPFNQFIREHLAGDVIAPHQPEVVVGSTFLVAGPYDDVGNQDVVAQASIRAATLDDIITATSGAFLGLTINCARCHYHKFDPIPSEDYYRLRAAFEGVRHGRRVVATEEQLQQHSQAIEPLRAEQAAVQAELQKLEAGIEQRASAELARLTYPRPKIDPQWTEETFTPISARWVKLVLKASTDNPNSAVGSKLVEVQVWAADPSPRNVALQSTGAKASGARGAVAEDFPAAYGPQLTIDGQFGAQWFVGHPAELTIELAEASTIERIAFSNAKGIDIQDQSQGATPCEYEMQVSGDGENWQVVADSYQREPWSPTHGVARLRAQVTTEAETKELQQLRTQLAGIQARIDAIPPLAVVWVGIREQPSEPTRLNIGGDPMKLGDVVLPSSLSVLDQTTATYALASDALEGERRLALANWIAADDNPLTVRVLANRVWQYHFGSAIVDTPSDFGFLGSLPTHPELLDWLAGQLLANGWRLKPLHRQILLSETYRQSSVYREQPASIDKDSRLLWRFPPRRLSAEELRDTMLLVSGNLQGTIPLATSIPNEDQTLAAGPGFRLYKLTENNVSSYLPLDVHGPETYRRAVYHQNARASVVDLLADFDFPDVAFAAPKRSSTTTPLQALTLLNHRFTLDMAQSLADRAEQSVVPGNPEALIDSMYELVLQRAARPDELAAAKPLLNKYGAAALARGLLNLNEVLYVE